MLLSIEEAKDLLFLIRTLEKLAKPQIDELSHGYHRQIMEAINKAKTVLGED